MKSPEPSNSDRDKVKTRPLPAADAPVRAEFPGPRGAAAKLRVAVSRSAYADLIAHAKESLEAEVCGVLVGQVCRDAGGPFVDVGDIIRGSAAAQGATHVTFTQATWDAIHQVLERVHPKQRIVGWYHTHPGFGVEFSEMDIFIQRNFFPAPTQIALVTDPMTGAVAIAVNADGAIEYLPRYWVDGREQLAQVPAAAPAAGGPAGVRPTEDLGQAVRTLEARINQLLQAHDDQRRLFRRVLLVAGLVICLGFISAAGYMIFRDYNSRLEPPRLSGFVPVPIKVGDKTVLVGVGVVQWEVPPELNAILLEEAARKRAEDDKEAALAAPTEAPKPTPPSK